jgi:hypothetical protein
MATEQLEQAKQSIIALDALLGEHLPQTINFRFHNLQRLPQIVRKEDKLQVIFSRMHAKTKFFYCHNITLEDWQSVQNDQAQIAYIRKLINVVNKFFLDRIVRHEKHAN